MAGKVKYKPTPRHTPQPHRKLAIRVAQAPPAPTPTTTTSPFYATNTTVHPNLTTAGIVWLTILSTFVIISIVTVCWLLFRCRRGSARKQRHPNGHCYHPSLEVSDGRNEFAVWNKNAMDRRSMLAQPQTIAMGTRREPHPGVPVIIDEVQGMPQTGRKRKGRYYGDGGGGGGGGGGTWGEAWKRFSQIGKAY